MSSTLCQLCGICPGTIVEEIKHILPIPACDCCLDQHYGPNTHFVGRLSHLPSFSIEFEIHTIWDHARLRALALLPYGYLRTGDSTVSDEYKSPIYGSLAAFRAHLPTLDTLSDLVDYKCGTHLHIGFPAELTNQLRGLREEVFGPLLARLQTDPDGTEEFWGRQFCTYASEDFDASYPCIRIGYHYSTVEYRLPRFRDAAHYLAVVRFCRRATYSVQRALTTLSSIDDPSGKGARAKALGITPEDLGVRLLHDYETALACYWHQVLPPLPVASD